MTFRVLMEKGAVRDLERLDRPVAMRIVQKLQMVGARGYGFEPLTNFEYGWKIRIGDYRALCDIDFTKRLIAVHVIAHRREVYR
jgi:mRNA interferase RelE/StbE